MHLLRAITILLLISTSSVATTCNDNTKITIDTYFSPRGGTTAAIVKEINLATTDIKVQAYSFTSDIIAQALVNAHNRGVKVTVILDKSQISSKGGDIKTVSLAGISTNVDYSHTIFHNKIMIIDSNVLITGSFNFTNNAEKSNAENTLIVKNSKCLIASYTENFNKHMEHTKPY